MVDDLDLQILHVLRQDARLSFRKIAKRINVATGTIKNRIGKLEKEGIIRKYSASIDYTKLGYAIAATIGISVNREYLETVEKNLAKNKNVFGIYEVTGEYDLFVGVRFKSMDELSAFIKRELAHKSIEKSTTYLILKTEKEAHTLLD